MSILSSNVKVLILNDSSKTSICLFPETTLFDSNIDIIGIENSIEITSDRLEKHKPDVCLIYIENSKNLSLVSRIPLPTLIVLNKHDDSYKSVNKKDRVTIVKPNISTKEDIQDFALSISNQIKNLFNTARTSVKSATKVIAIGASTGGTEAILEITKDLATNTCAILIVQHMPEVFSSMYAKRLNSLTKMKVREAKNYDRVVNGEILIAAGGFHLTLCRDDNGYFVHSLAGEKVCGHCPSVDVLFNSVADVAKNKALGIILTGMGKDGADGLLRMRKAGASTIGQNAETCIVYGMPDAAKNIDAVVKELPIQNIATEIMNYTNKN